MMPTPVMADTPPVELSVSEKVFGLSAIWMEVRRNFPFRERLKNLDADYLHAIDAVSTAPDLKSYYRELQIFLARLQDGHTFIQLPKGMYMTKSRPSMGVTRIGRDAVVTWVRSDLATTIPLGSLVQKVGDEPYQVAASRAGATVVASSAHVREDKQYFLAMEGERGSVVTLEIVTPQSETRTVSLVRGEKWPDGATALTLAHEAEGAEGAVSFKWLEGKRVAYIAITSFANNAIYEKFRSHLTALKSAKTVIVDLRGNSGGDDAVGYKILSHFLQRSGKGNAAHKFAYDPERAAAENHSDGAFLTAGVNRGMKQVTMPPDMIKPAPVGLRIKGKLIILTDHETVSAAEDFLVAASTIKHTRIGGRTAGSTGQAVVVRLPGGGAARILTKRDTFPTGREFVGVGIPADIEIEPTVEDVRGGRDVVIERTLEMIRQWKNSD